MGDLAKTQKELIDELVEMRRRVAELEAQEPSSDTSEEKIVEKALRESEEKYRFIVQKAHEGILIAQQGMHRFVNPAAARIWGHSEDELLSRPFIEFIHPDDRQVVLDRHMRRTKGEKPPDRYSFRIETKDGRLKWVEIDSAAISWEGKPAVLVFATDVTERKQMEEAIKEREAHYRNVVEESFDGIMITKGTKIVFVNSRLCQMLGYSSEELQGMDHWQTAHPDYRDVVHERAMARMSGKSVPASYEVRFQRKDGSSFDGDVRARTIEIQGALGVQVWIRDISERRKAEQALRESENRYRAIFDYAPTGINLNDRGRILQVNSAWTHMLGYTEDELRDLTPFDITHPDDLEITKNYHNVLVRGEINSYRYEKRYIRKDGQILWADLSVSAIRDEDGNYRASVAILTDITDKKRIQEALLESDERYRGLFEDSMDGIFVASMDGTLIDENESHARIYGYPRGEMIGQNLIRLYVNPDDRKRFATELLKKGAVKEYPLKLRRKDGTEIDTVHTTTVRRGKDGKVLEYRGIIRDITEKKNAEEALRQSEERFRLLIESAPIGVALIRQSRCMYVNAEFVQSFGYDDPKEIQELPIEALFAPEEKAGLLGQVRDEAAAKPIASHHETKGIKKDGTSFDVDIWATQIDYQGEPALLGFLVDTTEAKSLRAQLLKAQKMEAIGTLTGGIAHDFNNMLTVIMGFADLILSDADEDDPTRADLQKIIDTARDGASLVQRLLTYSRQTEARLGPLDVKCEAEKVTELLSRTIPKMISLELRLAENVAPVYGDAAQIQQVVMNLALNAASAMDNGGKLIIGAENAFLDDAYCTSHPGVQSGDYVLLTISDTGHGMDKRTMERMYDPFFTTKARGSEKGTGLGLAVVHSIVEQHGGHIRCDSMPGTGTRFELFFPAIKMELRPEDSPEKLQAPGGTQTILLVDDESLVRDFGERILTRAGYKVLMASNGREALDIYRKSWKRISLVVLDLMMPEMGGKQCIPEILKIDPEAKILVCTGYSSEDEESAQTVTAMVSGLVRKPLTVSSLLQAVRDTIDKE
jgi:two-component system cell cycle sensor histidine kinase/response regulator CckA